MKSAVPLLTLLFAGCTTTPGTAPSLLPRPIERIGFAEPVRQAAIAAPDPALDRELVEGGAQFDAALQAFERQVALARPAADRGATATAGSDAWIDAQFALGELGQAFSMLASRLADLEALAIARGAEGKPPYPALDGRIDAAQLSVDRSRETLEAIRTRVGA